MQRFPKIWAKNGEPFPKRRSVPLLEAEKLKILHLKEYPNYKYKPKKKIMPLHHSQKSHISKPRSQNSRNTNNTRKSESVRKFEHRTQRKVLKQSSVENFHDKKLLK